MEIIHNADLTMLTDMLIKTYKNKGSRRFSLGIAGIPGAGKSTLADSLMESINKTLNEEIAIIVPMDGFHYHNDILVKKGLLPLKGIPETFDAESFVKLIKAIASEKVETIYCPSYDRDIHNPVHNAIIVENKHKIVIVEGNYLLLEASPWNELANLFTETWFIDTEPTITKERLMDRHMKPGRTYEEALRKIDSTDTPNAELIVQTRHRANKIITVKNFT